MLMSSGRKGELRGWVHVQKEAGILERGMQALRHAISSLLGQGEKEEQPEDQVQICLLLFTVNRDPCCALSIGQLIYTGGG